jgi:AraC-like DNA-binding protein
MWSRTFGTSPRTPPGGGTVESMAPTAFERVADRVVERRRAVALARHYREAEGLSIGQIADRLGRSPATIKAYCYDPTGEKARAVKVRYQGVCRGCGAYTQARNGKGDAYAYCKRWRSRNPGPGSGVTSETSIGWPQCWQVSRGSAILAAGVVAQHDRGAFGASEVRVAPAHQSDDRGKKVPPARVRLPRFHHRAPRAPPLIGARNVEYRIHQNGSQ